MEKVVTYLTGAAAMLSMNVVANIIAAMRNVKIQWHNGTAIDCNPFTRVLRIPRVACASMLTTVQLMLLRGMVYHEAGHLLFTNLPKAQWPKGALMEIWNAVEDRWMERGVRNKFPGAKIVLPEMTRYYNQKIAKQIIGDKKNKPVDAPLWESLCAMGFMSDGIMPAWRLTPKAQLYFDAGYDVFVEWKGCKSSKGTLKVAEKLYDLLKDVHEQDKKEKEQEQGEPQQGEGQGESNESCEGQEGEGQSGEGQEGEGQSGEPQEGEQEGEPQSGGSKDFDDYENEKPEKGGSGEAGDEDSDEEGDESGAGDEASDEEGDESGKGKGADEGDEEGAESDSKGEDGEGDSEGDSGDEEGDKGESGSGEGEGDTDSDEEGEKGKEPDSINPGGKYNPNTDEDGDGDADSEGSADEMTWEEIAQRELDGQKLNEAMNEELADLLTEMAEDCAVYTARRDRDVHDIPKGDKRAYQSERGEVSGAVMSLTRALDQALRILSKDRTHHGLRRGRFDNRRMVQAAMGLSKNVFYKTSQGITLDTVVSIVIDESGSMWNMPEVRRLVIAIGEALTKIGVEFEVVGTTTKYCGGDARCRDMDGFTRTNPIVYRHYKIFGENWGNVAHRTTAMRATNHNCDGEAVEYVAQRLSARKEARKVVFSICDGSPCAGHGNDHQMAKNLKDVCKRVREQGIEVYGFGIGTEGPRSYYGKDNFIYLDDSGKMGTEFVKQFASIITGGRVKIGRAS